MRGKNAQSMVIWVWPRSEPLTSQSLQAEYMEMLLWSGIKVRKDLLLNLRDTPIFNTVDFKFLGAWWQKTRKLSHTR